MTSVAEQTGSRAGTPAPEPGVARRAQAEARRTAPGDGSLAPGRVAVCSATDVMTAPQPSSRDL